MNVTKRIARILPAKMKAAIRPFYRAFARQSIDNPSSLAIATFGNFEVAYRKETADEEVIEHSFDNDIFYSGVPEYQPDAGHIIIDIGAHIGTFALLSSRKVGHGHVHAIEASEDSFNYLKINVALNHCTNISIHHLAVSNREGECTLYHDSGNWGHSTVKRLSSSSEKVKSCTLSTFLKRNQISECHFMKLNCEGAEFPILLGASNSVLQQFDTILVLYHCDLWGDNTEVDLVTHLEASGFQCGVRQQSEKRGWIVAVNSGQLTNNNAAGVNHAATEDNKPQR